VFNLHGQGLVNQSSLTVEPGARLFALTSVSNTGSISNSGEVLVSGNFSNTGSPDIYGLVTLKGSGSQSISGNTNFRDTLKVDKSGGVATVSSGQTNVHDILRLANGTINANNNLVIASTVTGTGLVDDFSHPSFNGVVSGNLRVQRLITGVSGVHYIGSAVNSPDIATQLSELNPFGPNGAQVLPAPDCNPNQLYFGSPYGAIFEWHENGPFPGPSGWAPTCPQWGWHVRSSGTLTNGRGYSVNASSGLTIEVAGSANTSEVTTVNYAGLGVSNSVPDAGGWHLVSNPFPSPILWSLSNYLNYINGNISGGIAFWQTSGSYAGTYQSFIPSDNKQIGSMQGFFISVFGPDDWAIPQEMRVIGDPAFYKPDYSNSFEIIVEGSGYADNTRIRFGASGETNGYDQIWDARKLPSRYGQPTLLTRLNDVNYSINSLPIEGHPMTVPMDLVPGVSGTFKFRAEHLSSFDVEAHVYLEDLKVGKIQELTVNPIYEFTADENDDADRFLLHFRLNGEEPMYTGDDILMYANNGSAYVFLPEFDGKAQFDVFNALGELVYTKSNLYEGKNTYDLSQLATGAYVFRLMVNNKPISKKVIL